MELTIDNDLRALVPNLSLGVIFATLRVRRDIPELSSEISKYIDASNGPTVGITKRVSK